jgi:pimeloyl-ACP methyl ester carboxylesterase
VSRSSGVAATSAGRRLRAPDARAAPGSFSQSTSAGALERFADCPVKWLVENILRPDELVPDPEQMVRLSLRVLAADPSSIPEGVVRLLVDLTRERKDDPGVATSFLEAARSMMRLGRRSDVSRRALESITCPVLVLHGRRDRLVPVEFAEAELARHPAWRGRFFRDLGHIPQMEAPGRWLAEVADWFADTLD